MTPALAATYAVLENSSRPLTVREVAERLGISYTATDERLRRLVFADVVIRTTKIRSSSYGRHRVGVFQPGSSGSGDPIPSEERFYVTGLSGFPIDEQPFSGHASSPPRSYQVLDRAYCHRLVAEHHGRHGEGLRKAKRQVRRLNEEFAR